MVKKTGPTNYQCQELLVELESKARDNKFWNRIAKDLRKSARQKKAVNIYKINKFAREGETIVVAGKVLSVGEINKKIDVAALNFSEGAKKKIEEAKGKTITLKELFEQNPNGKNVRILG